MQQLQREGVHGAVRIPCLEPGKSKTKINSMPVRHKVQRSAEMGGGILRRALQFHPSQIEMGDFEIRLPFQCELQKMKSRALMTRFVFGLGCRMAQPQVHHRRSHERLWIVRLQRRRSQGRFIKQASLTRTFGRRHAFGQPLPGTAFRDRDPNHSRPKRLPP